MTAVVLLITPILIYAQNHKYKKRSKKGKEEVLHVAAKETEIPAFSKQRLLLIKSFSTEQQELQHFIEKANQCVVPAPQPMKNFWKVKVLKSMIFRVFQIILTSYGVSLMFKEKVSFGDLLAFNLYFTEFINSITSTLTNFKALLKSLVHSDQLFKVLEYDPKIKVRRSHRVSKEKAIRGSMTLRRIDFAYPMKSDVKVIENISLDIKVGESVAFIGPDNSGKSTLVHLLMRLYDVTEGKIFVGGENIKNYDVMWLHDNIGYVAEDPMLVDGTFEDNLLYGLGSYENLDLNKYIMQANAGFLLDKRRFPQGLETQIHGKGIELSVSEKQRVCIARALIRDPKILILDEPTKHLESEDAGELQKAIDGMVALKDKTVIVTAKSFETVANCVKVYSLGEGRILEGKSVRVNE